MRALRKRLGFGKRDSAPRDFESRASRILARLLKDGWEVRERLYYLLRAALKDDHDSTLYAIRVYRRFFLEYLRHRGGLIPPRSALELGPGRNLAIALLAVSAGTGRYVAADLNPKLRGRPLWFYRQLIEEIEADPTLLVGDPAAAQRGAANARSLLTPRNETAAEAEVGGGRVEYLCPCDAAHLPFGSATFDYVFSNAAFEHFYDPAGALRELRRVLRPGAVTIHKIDFRYHRDQSRPLTHLAYSPQEWEERKKHHGWTNRWRRADYVREAESAGFEILEARVTSRAGITPEQRASFHPDFQALSEEELSALGILLALRAPAA